MPPVKLSEREKSLVYITLGFVLFYLVFQIFMAPKWEEIDRLKLKLRDARLELKIAEGKIEVLDNLQKTLGSANLQANISHDDKALEALRSISQTTSRSKLKLLSIKPTITDTGAKYDLTCSGTYRGLYEFFGYLREAPMLISVGSLYVTGGDAGSEKLSIRLSLTAPF